MSEFNEFSENTQTTKLPVKEKILQKLRDLKRGYSDEQLATTHRIASGNITGDDIADERRRQLKDIEIPEGSTSLSANSRVQQRIEDIKGTSGKEYKQKMIQDAQEKLAKWGQLPTPSNDSKTEQE